MKTRIYYLVFLLTLITLLSSCKKDEDKPKPVDPRISFSGVFQCRDTYFEGGVEKIMNYSITISPSQVNESDISIQNIAGLNQSVRATVTGNTFIIPQQTIAAIGISGSGTINGNILNMSYILTLTNGTNVNVNSVGTKQ